MRAEGAKEHVTTESRLDDVFPVITYRCSNGRALQRKRGVVLAEWRLGEIAGAAGQPAKKRKARSQVTKLSLPAE